MTYFSRSPVDFQFLEMSFSRILVQTGKGIVFQSKTVSFWNMATCRLFFSVAIPSLPPLHSENPFPLLLRQDHPMVAASSEPILHQQSTIEGKSQIVWILPSFSIDIAEQVWPLSGGIGWMLPNQKPTKG